MACSAMEAMLRQPVLNHCQLYYWAFVSATLCMLTACCAVGSLLTRYMVFLLASRPLLAVAKGHLFLRQATARKQSLPACKTHASVRDNPSIADTEPAVSHEEAFYDWKYGTSIRYTRAGTQGPPLLLAHGFGVGAYHFERNIPELAANHRVFAVDILGQGGSWPTRELQPGEGPLRYCAETWTEQLHHFIQEYIGEPVYVVGNSLGGFLGANLAANHPDAVKGLILLNAAPFWSFRPPGADAKGIWKLLQSDGTLPVPEVSSQSIMEYDGGMPQLGRGHGMTPYSLLAVVKCMYEIAQVIRRLWLAVNQQMVQEHKRSLPYLLRQYCKQDSPGMLHNRR